MLDSDSVDWESKLPLKDPHESCYRLFLISALMTDPAPEESALFTEEFYSAEARRRWKTRFAEKGGLQHISRALALVPDILSLKAASIMVSLVLEILGWYIFTSMQTNGLLPREVKQILIMRVEDGKSVDQAQNFDFDAQLEMALQESVTTSVRQSSSISSLRITAK